MSSKSSCRFADLSSFESCSASVSAFRSSLELLAHRAFDGDEPLLVEQHAQARLDLDLTLDVVVGRVHRDRRSELGQELVDDRAGGLEPVALDALPDRVAVVATRSPSVRSWSSHFGLPAWLRRSSCASQSLRDLGVRDLERLEQHLLGDLVGAGLDHRQAVLRADDDQVELGRLPRSRCNVGLTTSSPSIRPMRTAPTGPKNGSGESISAADAPLMQRMSCAVTMSAREHGADDLHLVAEALRPERPDRAVDHPRGEGGALAGASLALEEAAGDLARRRTCAPRRRSSAGRSRRPRAASDRPTAVASTIVSPERTTTAPSACFASLPVSKLIS